MNYKVEAFNRYPLSDMLNNSEKMTTDDGRKIKIFNKPELNTEEDKKVFLALLIQYGWSCEDDTNKTIFFMQVNESKIIIGGVADTQEHKLLSNIVVASACPLPQSLYILNDKQLESLLDSF